MDLITRYLAELQAGLRTVAGRVAGLTQRDAQRAAISAFGTVRAEARANYRPRATRAEPGLAAGQAVGVYLLTVFAVSFVVYAVVRQAVSSSPPGQYPFATPRGYPGPPALWLGCGMAGLALLTGCQPTCAWTGQRSWPPSGSAPASRPRGWPRPRRLVRRAHRRVEPRRTS
jgi:hypothetical protein